MTRTPKRPRDTNQLAKMVVDMATGQKEAREARRLSRSHSSEVAG
jgi:hypothetical protein